MFPSTLWVVPLVPLLLTNRATTANEGEFPVAEFVEMAATRAAVATHWGLTGGGAAPVIDSAHL